MSETSFLRRRWKLILNVMTLVALGFLIYATRQQLGNTLGNLRYVNAWALLLLIPLQVINYHAQTKLFQHLFAMVGNKLSYGFLYRTALELNFVNHVFPSGGVTGMSYFTLRMRKGKELSGGKATLVNVIKIGLVFLSFELLIILGLLSLAAMGRVNNLTILVATAISTLLLVGTVLFVYLVGSKSRINHFFTNITRALNRIITVVRPRHPETININRARQVFDDFHDNYKAIRSNYRKLMKGPFWYAFLANLTEVLAVYVVFIAFNEYINIGAVILAYAVANFAGLVSVLPGGVGIYEGLMVAVLATAGVSPGVSLPVIVMYRVANTLIQIPPGYYFYQKTLQQGDQSKGARGAAA